MKLDRPLTIDSTIASIAVGKAINPMLLEGQVYGGATQGIGEPGLVPTAPAIANAIYDAVGVRIKDLPITPEKVLAALKQKQG